MDDFELAATKLDRIIEKAFEGMAGRVNKIIFDMGRRNIAGGSGERSQLAKVILSSAEEVRREAIGLFIDLEGVRLDRARVAGHIRERLDSMYSGFMSAYGSTTSVPVSSDPDLPDKWSRIVDDVELELDAALKMVARNASPAAPQALAALAAAPDMAFMRDPDCRKAAVIAVEESAKCLGAGAFNAAVVMAGSALEGVLLDALLQDPSRALAQKSAKGKDPDLRKWHLPELIAVAAEMGLLKEDADKLSAWVTKHRNFVHPGRMLREERAVTGPDARAAFAILEVVCEKLR